MSLPPKILGLLSKADTPNLEQITRLALVDLPVRSLHGIGPVYARLLKTIGINTIRELAFLDYEIVNKSNSRVKTALARKWTIAAKIILKFSQGSQLEQKRIIFAGLDRAGKTSIIFTIRRFIQEGKIGATLPTVGVQLEKVHFAGFPILVWDFGGQKAFRDTYLRSGQQFINMGLVFFIIDTTDYGRYAEAIDYLAKLIQLLEHIEEHPSFIVQLHKVEEQSQSILKRLDDVQNEIIALFKQHSWIKYDFARTSIKRRKELLDTFVKGIKLLSPVATILDDFCQEIAEEMGNSPYIRIFSESGFIIAEHLQADFQQKTSEMDKEIRKGLMALDKEYKKKNFWIIDENQYGRFFYTIIPLSVENIYTTIILGENFKLDENKIKAFSSSLKIWLMNLLTPI